VPLAHLQGHYIVAILAGDEDVKEAEQNGLGNNLK